MSTSYHLAGPYPNSICGVCFSPLQVNVVSHHADEEKGHPLHYFCALEEFAKNPNCPICRIPVNADALCLALKRRVKKRCIAQKADLVPQKRTSMNHTIGVILFIASIYLIGNVIKEISGNIQ